MNSLQRLVRPNRAQQAAVRIGERVVEQILELRMPQDGRQFGVFSDVPFADVLQRAER
jgi:hypothetical protein